MTPRIALRGICKRYGAVVANDDVALEVQPGEILAILGENGAGKSTLMKIIYGVVQADAGSIAVDGMTVAIANPAQARALGVAMVFQHFALFDTLTVAENVALGLPPAPLADVSARIIEHARRYGLEIDPRQHVHDLSVGERQRVEILRALLSTPRLLILDEPTSVLTPQAVDRLFDTLRQLAGEGVSVVFISHKLDEIRRLATRCVVMRAGRVVADVDPRTESEAGLARRMIGADPPAIAAHDTPPGEVALQVRQLVTRGAERRHWLNDISFDLHGGEIVGVAGISGNGQAALMAVLAGEWRAEPDSIRLHDRPIGHLGPAERRALGLRYVPEERLGHAAVPGLTLAENVLLTGDALHLRGLISLDRARERAEHVLRRFDVRARGPTARAESLSGGNLQKFIVGREVEGKPRVLLVNQPTVGVDVGAAARIRNELIAMRTAGCGVLVVSEELDELYAICDRLIVIAKGRASPAVRPSAIGVDEIGRWMAGLWPEARAA